MEEIAETKLKLRKNTYKKKPSKKLKNEMSLGDINMYIIAKNHDEQLLHRPDYRRRHFIKH